MENSPIVPFKAIAQNEDLAKKKAKERLIDFRKPNIELAFVDVDEQLKQLAKLKDIGQVRRFVPSIRNQLFEIYNLCVHGLDVRQFASHKPGERTPLNSECC